jgi:RNA polymerase sigma factor (sigma-70 family)
MRADDLDQRLSRISTQWALIHEAHGDSGGVSAAQAALLLRYRNAAVRYLFAALRDADAAEELAQELCLRFLRGDFRRASPERGRFRDYLRTALIHLIHDHHRARQAAPWQLAPAADPAAPAAGGEDEGDFEARWREELLERTWEALGRASAPYRAVLALRVQGPELTSAQIAERVAAELGRPATAEWVRKALQRAHEKFADLLVAEVGRSLETDDAGAIEEELRALNLLGYCRSALDRRRPAR